MRLALCRLSGLLLTLLLLWGSCVQAANLRAEYRFDSCSLSNGGSLADSSGNGYDGTVHNMDTASGGVVCRAGDFSADGTSDYVSLPHQVLNGLSAFSVSLWFKTTESKSQQELIQALGSSANDDEFELYLRYGNRVRVRIQGGSEREFSHSSNFNDGNWHNLVFTRDGIQGCVYIDNQRLGSCQSFSSTPLSVRSGTLLMGQEQDSYGGNFSNSQSLRAVLDEVKFYLGALGTGERNAIYSNEGAAKNADGSSRVCAACVAGLWASYGFEEASWSGANSVLDDSGNDRHGTPVGAVSPVMPSPSLSCQALDVPKNSWGYSQNAVDTGVRPSDVGSRGSIMFWYKADELWNGSSGWHWGVDDRMLFDASTSGVNFFAQLTSDGRLDFRVEDSVGRDFTAITARQSFGAGEWVHVAVTWDMGTGETRVWLNGQSAASASNFSSGSLGSTYSLYIGDNRGDYWFFAGTNNSAAGEIDNFRILSDVVSQTGIQTEMLNLTPCDTDSALALYHFDEENWGTVEDSGGNGYHGVATNGAYTAGDDPALSGDPGTCRYGVFDRNNDYVALPGFPDLTGDFTITAWIKPTGVSGDQRIFVDDEDNTDANGYGLSLGDGGNGRLRFFNRSVSPVSLDSSAVITANTWHFVAIVHDVSAKRRYIYADGATNPVAEGTYTGTWASPVGMASIGGEVDTGTEASATYRFGGFIDEVRVYTSALSGTEIADIRDLRHDCQDTTSVAAFAFNCVASGADAVNGHLYTSTVGSSVGFDLVALKDSDSDGTADAQETDFASDADRTVSVELVDTSSGSCASHASLSPAVSLSAAFTAADAGRVSLTSASISRAYRSVGCRVVDATDSSAVVTACSSDSFAVRPTSLQILVPLLTNAGATGDPHAVAGSSFSLQATAVAGYDGTPLIDNSRLQAHAGAVRLGTLSGAFDAADPSDGTANGDAFSYDEVGNLQILSQGVYDDDFTAVDQSAGDCTDDFSNTRVSGLVGCKFGNSSASDWIGRFTPHHFEVVLTSDGALANSCTSGGFSYAGETLGYASGTVPGATITAYNSAGVVTRNYTGSYAKLGSSSVSMPAITGDGTQLGVDGVTAVTLSWTPGSPTLTDNGDGTFAFALSSVDSFVYGRTTNDRVAPFTSDVELEISAVVDDDSIAATGLPLSWQPAGVEIRHGRLAMQNAYGSELRALAVPLWAEYYDGSANGYVVNTDDNCSAVASITLTDPDTGDSLAVSDTCPSTGSILAAACSAGAGGVWSYAQTAAAGGYSLYLAGPGSGHEGVLRLSADGPAHLQFDWNGAGEEDPSAQAVFGIYGNQRNIIYQRERR